jgi:hypothetical protein
MLFLATDCLVPTTFLVAFRFPTGFFLADNFFLAELVTVFVAACFFSFFAGCLVTFFFGVIFLPTVFLAAERLLEVFVLGGIGEVYHWPVCTVQAGL